MNDIITTLLAILHEYDQDIRNNEQGGIKPQLHNRGIFLSYQVSQ